MSELRIKNRSELSSHRRGFIAQSVEHRTGIAEVMGSNPVGASDFFLGFICGCLSYFTSAKISFTSILCLILSICRIDLSLHLMLLTLITK